MGKSIFVSDKFKAALEKVNEKLEENRQLQNDYRTPPHSKKYREALEKEIKLLKKKNQLIKDEQESIEKKMQ